MKFFIQDIFKRPLNVAVVFVFGVVLAGCSSAENSANVKVADGAGTNKSNVAENKIADTNSEKVVANSVQNKVQDQTKVSEQCQLTKAPVLERFYLGESVDEVGKRVTNFKAAYEKEKTGNLYDKKVNFVLVTSGGLSQMNGDSGSKEFDDVSLIWHFLDDKLMGIVVKYFDDDADDIKTFVTKVSKENNLPQDGWKIGKEQSATLTCQGFEVLASTHPQNGPSIMVFDTAAEKEKEKRGK